MPQFGSNYGQSMGKKSREITLYNGYSKEIQTT